MIICLCLDQRTGPPYFSRRSVARRSTAAVPADQGAQCWEDHAAELYRMLWSSVLGGWHVIQVKPVLMQQLVTHARNLVFKPSSKLMTKALCSAPGALTRYPATQFGAPRQVGCQL